MKVTLNNLIDSITAHQKKIDNKPKDETVKNNLNKTLKFLNSLDWNGEIIVNSGYRCKELNEAVGGVPSSHHTLGLAADITADKLSDFLVVVKERISELDQLIYYPKRKFIHISVHPNNRKQYLVK